MTRDKVWRWVLAVAVATLLAGGCGDDADDAPDSRDEPVSTTAITKGATAAQIADALHCEDAAPAPEMADAAPLVTSADSNTAVTCFAGPDEVLVLAATSDPIEPIGNSMPCQLGSGAYAHGATWLAFADTADSDRSFEVASGLAEQVGAEVGRFRC